MVGHLRKACMTMVLSFRQRCFELLSLLVPEADVPPRHKAAHKEDRRQKNEWRPRPHANKYQEGVQASQARRQHYARNQHGERQYRAAMRARIGERVPVNERCNDIGADQDDKDRCAAISQESQECGVGNSSPGKQRRGRNRRPLPQRSIRGGLQAIPRGQAEAASALGLSWSKTTALIVMPQALRHVIPGLVNSFIALFKDTSLVSIVALFDLLGQ